jgi:hypothetical protein
MHDAVVPLTASDHSAQIWSKAFQEARSFLDGHRPGPSSSTLTITLDGSNHNSGHAVAEIRSILPPTPSMGDADGEPRNQSDPEDEGEDEYNSLPSSPPPSSHAGSGTTDDYQPSMGQGAPLIDHQLDSDVDLVPDNERLHLKGMSCFNTLYFPFNHPKKRPGHG